MSFYVLLCLYIYIIIFFMFNQFLSLPVLFCLSEIYFILFILFVLLLSINNNNLVKWYHFINIIIVGLLLYFFLGILA